MELFRKQEENFTVIREKLEKAVYTPVEQLAMEGYRTKEPVPYADRRSGEHFIPKVGETWGELFDCAWFHFTGKVPANAKGKKCVLLIDFSGEGLVYNEKGEPTQGLTSTTSRNEFPLGLWGKRTVEVSACAAGDEYIDLWVDAGCNDVEGQYRNDGKVKEAVIATVDSLCRDLFYDWVVCQSLYVGLCENKDPYGEEILPILQRAEAELQSLTPDTMTKAREILSEILSKKNDHTELTYSSIGHSHLDLLFLWPLRETIRKGARTYSTVLKLMKLYPEYKFGCSQAPLYQWMKQYYPHIYEGICERIKEGRWEVQGSFWVECDTNLPGGESLVRQLLYGKRFFKEEFGQEMKVGFLPDVFGYSGALPQLLIKSETPYFMTQKLSWNDTNRFPRHTFWWQGIDGSQVLTHMLSEDSYNSAAVPQMAIYGLHHNRDLDKCKDALQLFGLGDGGGGPGYEHMERKRRSKDLKGCPPHRDEFVIDFFERIAVNKDSYRKWVGELYFERHQGTYTSIARVKRYNRRVEQKLQTLEWLSVLAEVYCGLPYPKERLEDMWKEILLYQFHDCLPGSAITRVYEEAYARYQSILEELEEKIHLAQVTLSNTLHIEDMTMPVLLFNATSFDRQELITSGDHQFIAEIPAYGFTVQDLARTHTVVKSPIENLHLENDYVSIDFTENGTISSIIQKETGFSLLKEKEEGNKLCLYPDEFTHWDINKAYLLEAPEQARLEKAQPFVHGGIQGIHLFFKVGNSTINQTVTLKDNSARLDFVTEVDWQEEYRMLRVAFPTSIITDHAECEIQFGHLSRPTHQNTSWDEAKFEVCAHKWVDMADIGGGIALLNDCKYGYKIWDNTLDLCLLRSQNCPSEHGDQGKHQFTYSLFPHTKDVVQGNVIKEGYALNYPIDAVIINQQHSITGVAMDNSYVKKEVQKIGNKTYSPININSKNILVESWKKAEDTDGYILRLYEAGGQRTKAQITFCGFQAEGLCNLLERPLMECRGSSVEIEFHPFEVHTLLLRKDKI
jgi:alpha-mannosidase